MGTDHSIPEFQKTEGQNSGIEWSVPITPFLNFGVRIASFPEVKCLCPLQFERGLHGSFIPSAGFADCRHSRGALSGSSSRLVVSTFGYSVGDRQAAAALSGLVPSGSRSSRCRP